MSEGIEPLLARLEERLAHMDTKLDRLTSDHETRLRKVERWIYAVPPTLLIAASSVIAQILASQP
jgi:hypothetical protein